MFKPLTHALVPLLFGSFMLPAFAHHSAAPHYDLLLAGAEYRDAQVLLAVFGSPEPNPYKRRRR